MLKPYSFILARDRRVLVERRAILDLLSGEFDRKAARWPIRLSKRYGGDKHLATGQPPTRIGHHVPNRPSVLIEQKIRALAYISVFGLEHVANEFISTAQHAFCLLFENHPAHPERWGT
jgi:hypothetical protein